jgi:hypothetical protein
MRRCDLCRKEWPEDSLAAINARRVCPDCAPSYRRLLRLVKNAVLGLLTVGGIGAAWLGLREGAGDPGMQVVGYGIAVAFLGVVLVHLFLESRRQRRLPAGTRLEP